VRALFDEIDEDKSGTIELDEMWQVVKDLDLGITYKEIRKEFDFVDVDGSHTIDFMEFKRMMEARVGLKYGLHDDGGNRSPTSVQLQNAFKNEKLMKNRPQSAKAEEKRFFSGDEDEKKKWTRREIARPRHKHPRKSQ